MATGNNNITAGGYSNYFGGEGYAIFTLLGTPGKIARYLINPPLTNPALKGILELETGQDNPTTIVVNNGTGFGLVAPVVSPSGVVVKGWMNPPPTAAPTAAPTATPTQTPTSTQALTLVRALHSECCYDVCMCDVCMCGVRHRIPG